MRHLFLLLLLFLPLAASEHHGVVESGSLRVPGASVTATRGDQRFTTVTNVQGLYSFAHLEDGLWNVRVEMLCFAPSERQVRVAPDGPGERWELTMMPLAEMHAERQPAAPPSSPNSPTPTAAPSGAFQRADPKAAPAAPAAAQEPQPVQEAESDGLLINGSVNNGADSATAQSPTFGNFRRSGNHLYNGTVSIDAGNSALDARPFSLTGQNTPRPSYSQMTTSFSLGGPLTIPHLWKASKALYAYVSYERTRNSSATAANGLMPEAAQRAGDFTSRAAAVLDPTTGAPFAGNRIPDSRLSPQARGLLALYPKPAFTAAAGYNYQVPLLSATHRDSIRGGIFKGSLLKSFFSGNFSLDSTRSDNPNLFHFLDTNRGRSVRASAAWMRSWNASLHSDLTLQWDRVSSTALPYFANRENVSGHAGINGNNQDPVNWGPPDLTFASGLASLNDGRYSSSRNQGVSLVANVDWRHGNHNFKLGAKPERRQLNLLSQENPRGSFFFSGAFTGSDLADLLLGLPTTSAIAFGNADKYFRSSSYSAFVRDDWRVITGFSLNVGLRWEYNTPVRELYGRLVNLAVDPAFTVAAPVTGAALQPDRSLLQPRAGFAWRVSPVHSLIMRGGYGIYADSSVYQSIASRMAQQAPFSKSLSVESTAANPLTLADGFRGSANLAPATFAVDPEFRVGYAQNWQLSVQHGLPGGLVVIADYLGTKGAHARQAVYPNTYPSGIAAPCTVCPSGFAYLSSGGSSSRHAAQFRLRRRLHSGLFGSLQYTFAKAIDDATVGGEAQSRLLVAQDWSNLAAERALSSFDQRHQLTLQAQYSTGVGLRGGALMEGWRGGLLKDWTIGTDLTAGSGLPLTPVYPVPVSGTGFSGSVRPDYTGAPLYDAPPGLAINPAAFAAPAPGRWGNAGRNSITGPSQFGLNASLMRTFRMNDRLGADLRFELTNALNHVTYRSWNASLGSPLFGLPDSANSMRTVRAHLRLRF